MMTPEEMQYIWDDLLNCALALNDKLKFEVDHVVYTGDMNVAEEYRTAVNNAWHIRAGWKK